MKSKLPIYLLLVTLILATASPAFSQCAMCRENAAGAGDGGRAINLGILVLLAPTLAMFVGVIVFALRRRDALLSNRGEARPSVPLGWPAYRR